MHATAITLRNASLDDAAAIAQLSAMFGYANDVAAHTQRLAALLARGDHTVFVAEHAGSVCGWLHAMQRLSLESDRYVEIAGLVVDEALRSRGIGARLLAAAEDWARQQGYAQIRVRSNLIRERTLAFYRRERYAPLKQQQVFAKTL